MTILHFGDILVDQSQYAKLQHAEAALGFNLTIVQGSWRAGHGATQSAGTHDAGGVIDLSTIGLPKSIDEVILQLRLAGMIAWHRTVAEGFSGEHIHAIDYGNPNLSPAAAAQVAAYEAGRNGLANNGPDDGPRVNIPKSAGGVGVAVTPPDASGTGSRVEVTIPLAGGDGLSFDTAYVVGDLYGSTEYASDKDSSTFTPVGMSGKTKPIFFKWEPSTSGTYPISDELAFLVLEPNNYDPANLSEYITALTGAPAPTSTPGPTPGPPGPPTQTITAADAAAGSLFLPTSGPITQEIHDVWTGFPALDFGVPIGTPVYAGADGQVVRSEDLETSYGHWIQIDSSGFSTLYAHLSQRNVNVGDQVRGGQLIGLSGSTGNSTGPHLHFGAQGIDPHAFLTGGTSHPGGAGTGGFGGSFIDLYDWNKNHIGGGGSSYQATVQGGETYYVVLAVSTSVPSSAIASHALRIGLPSTTSDWVTPEPHYVRIDFELGGFSGYYTIYEPFGGQRPGEHGGATSCAWRWALTSAGGSQWWSPNGLGHKDSGTTIFDAWGPDDPGLCMTYSVPPGYADHYEALNFISPGVNWGIYSSDVQFDLPQTVEARFAGSFINPKYIPPTLTNSDVSAYPSAQGSIELRPGVNPGDPATAIGARLRIPLDWKDDGDGEPMMTMLSTPGENKLPPNLNGPEIISNWEFVTAGREIVINNAVGFGKGTEQIQIFFVPHAALDLRSPVGDTAMGINQSVSRYSDVNLELYALYQGPEYRVTQAPVTPTLTPSSAPSPAGLLAGAGLNGSIDGEFLDGDQHFLGF